MEFLFLFFCLFVFNVYFKFFYIDGEGGGHKQKGKNKSKLDRQKHTRNEQPRHQGEHLRTYISNLGSLMSSTVASRYAFS